MELLVNSATREREEAQAEALDTENANRPRDIPETGTVTTESPDTGDEADAGEDGPVEGASESDVDPDTIPAELVRELDRALMAWSVRVLGGNKLSKEVKQDWNELVAPQWGVISHALDLSPPKPHGTVNAHLAEQMEDPEFRAAYEAAKCEASAPAEDTGYPDAAALEWMNAPMGPMKPAPDESELRTAAKIVVATLHCGEAATTRYKQEEHMDLKAACHNLAGVLESDSTGG